MSILIRKALEILEADQKETKGKIPPDLWDARQLAYEAAEEITYLRAALEFCKPSYLETELPEQCLEASTPTPF
jgi:hypothetical protein